MLPILPILKNQDWNKTKLKRSPHSKVDFWLSDYILKKISANTSERKLTVDLEKVVSQLRFVLVSVVT